MPGVTITLSDELVDQTNDPDADCVAIVDEIARLVDEVRPLPRPIDLRPRILARDFQSPSA